MFVENLNGFPCEGKTFRRPHFCNIINAAANNPYILFREAGKNSYQKAFSKNLTLDWANFAVKIGLSPKKDKSF